MDVTSRRAHVIATVRGDSDERGLGAEAVYHTNTVAMAERQRALMLPPVQSVERRIRCAVHLARGRFDPSIRYRAREDASASIKARAATKSAVWKPSVNRSWIGWRNANASVKRP